MTTTETPFLVETFRMYRTWNTRAAVYITVFLLSVGTALLLDLRFGVQPSMILFYVLTVTAVLMIAVPAAAVGANRLLWPWFSRYIARSKLSGLSAVLDEAPMVAHYVSKIEEELREAKASLEAALARERLWANVVEERKLRDNELAHLEEKITPEARQEPRQVRTPDGMIRVGAQSLVRIQEFQQRLEQERLPDEVAVVVLNVLGALWLVHSLRSRAQTRLPFEHPYDQTYRLYATESGYEQGMEDLTTTILDHLSALLLSDPRGRGSHGLATGKMRIGKEEYLLFTEEELLRFRRRE